MSKTIFSFLVCTVTATDVWYGCVAATFTAYVNVFVKNIAQFCFDLSNPQKNSEHDFQHTVCINIVFSQFLS